MNVKTRSKIALFVYCLLCNIPVCFFLCLAAAIVGASDFDSWVLTINFTSVSWLNLLYNFLFGLTIAMLVGMLVPLSRIGRWFTALFHVKNDTYTGNMPYRLLSTLIITLIYYVAITPSLTLFNYFVLKIYTTPAQAGVSFLINIPIMLIVGFTSSLINDVGAYRVAHMIDSDF